MFGTQLMARKPGYLMRLVHGLEHRKRRATAHIRGQRRRHAGPLGGGKIKQAAAQELIRRGAVRRHRAGFPHTPPVRVVEPYAMPVYRSAAQQADGKSTRLNSSH